MWHISGTVARWSDARCEATVDLHPRHGGLRLTRLFDRPVDWGPLLLGPPEPAPALGSTTPAPSVTSSPGGTYVRGNDLILGYPLADLGLEACIYWRWLTPAPGARGVGFEWIGSYITQRAAATSHVAQSSVLPIATDILFPETAAGGESPTQGPVADMSLRMARRGGDEYSYVEMTYPGDLGSARLSTSPADAGSAANRPTGWELQLALEQLEKGVLRRYRARCLWVPSATDQAEALQAWAHFVNSPPPLET